MSLDALLWLIRELRLILVSPTELWPDPRIGPSIRRALKRHRRGLTLLLREANITVCSSPDLHRSFYYHRDGRYICGMCEQLLPEVERRAA